MGNIQNKENLILMASEVELCGSFKWGIEKFCWQTERCFRNQLYFLNTPL